MSRLDNLLFISLIARSNAQVWEVIPKYRVSTGTIDVLSGMVLKSISEYVPNEKIKRQVDQLGEKVFNHGTANMKYKEEEPCGTPPIFHVPFKWPWPPPPLSDLSRLMDVLKPESGGWKNSIDDVMLNPQPLPPKELLKKASEELKMLSAIITNKDYAVQAAAIAKELDKSNKS